MPRPIDGVRITKQNDVIIGEIQTLSDDLKTEIRNRLSTICYGPRLAATQRGHYTYSNTIREFLKRYSTKSEATKTGMLGEFLFHIVIGIAFPTYQTIIPFFNSEERSIRKGFDSLIFSSRIGLFPCEIKSRRSSSPTDVDKATNDLIQIAHTDITMKLADDDTATRLWINAMNGFQISHKNHKTCDTITQIILTHQEATTTTNKQSKKHDALLSSVVISPANCGARLSTANNAHAARSSSYNRLLIVSIHKPSTTGLLQFLQHETKA